MKSVVPPEFKLQETPSNYLQRNEWNVRDSDATLIFTLTPAPSPLVRAGRTHLLIATTSQCSTSP